MVQTLSARPEVARIAARHRVSSATVLLAWGLQRGTSVVAKSFSPSNTRSNIAQLRDFRLGQDDFNAIEALRDGDSETRFNDPTKHWGFDIYNEHKDEPAEEDVELINRRVGALT